MSTQQALALLDSTQKEIDAQRERGRQRYAVAQQESGKLLREKQIELPDADNSKLQQQMIFRTQGIIAARLRHEIDTEILLLVHKKRDKLRKAMKTLRRAKTEFPKGLSAYITQLEMEESDKDTEEMLKKDQDRIAQWRTEMTKWETSWRSNVFDYNMPNINRGHFRFDYDTGEKIPIQLPLPNVVSP